MNKSKYNLNKSSIENAMAKAEYYESIGDTKEANKFLLLAEKIEKVLKKNRNDIPKKTEGLR